jgi:phage terminase small subunit
VGFHLLIFCTPWYQYVHSSTHLRLQGAVYKDALLTGMRTENVWYFHAAVAVAAPWNSLSVDK